MIRSQYIGKRREDGILMETSLHRSYLCFQVQATIPGSQCFQGINRCYGTRRPLSSAYLLAGAKSLGPL